MQERDQLIFALLQRGYAIFKFLDFLELIHQVAPEQRHGRPRSTSPLPTGEGPSG